MSLELEIAHRKDAGKPLMIEGDTIRCATCNAELICDRGTEDKLRWRWNGF